jgi:hypothetical protein
MPDSHINKMADLQESQFLSLFGLCIISVVMINVAVYISVKSSISITSF